MGMHMQPPEAQPTNTWGIQTPAQAEAHTLSGMAGEWAGPAETLEDRQ